MGAAPTIALCRIDDETHIKYLKRTPQVRPKPEQGALKALIAHKALFF
jgi:hypothetical protein